jgi:hypothetical protein
MKFASFPSIEGFHNVVKLTRSYRHLAEKPIHYKGKIKLQISLHNLIIQKTIPSHCREHLSNKVYCY